MHRELIEVIERETLVDLQPEVIVDVQDNGGQVVDASTSELLIDDTPDLLVVEEERQTVLLDIGTQGPPGPPGEAGGSYIEFPAGVNLGGHRAVRLVAGAAVYADNATLADANLVLGITRGAAMAGELAQIQTMGLMTEPSWSWTADQPVFVGPGGLLTQTAPAVGFSLIVGVAVSPMQIHIGQKMPIVLE